MAIHYKSYNGFESFNLLEQLISLHIKVFGDSDDLAGRMAEKPKLHIDAALDEEKLIGYKIGYA